METFAGTGEMSAFFATVYLVGWLWMYFMHMDRGPTWWIGGLFVSTLWPVFFIMYWIEESKHGDY